MRVATARSGAGLRRLLPVVVSVALVLASPSRARGDVAAPSPTATPQARPAQGYFYGSGIALLMNRVTLGYDHFVAPHHSLGLSGFGMILGITHGGPNVAKGTVFGAGAELEYRYYAGDNGPVGPFFGVSAIGGYYHSRADLYEADKNARWYKQAGAAIDMGWAGHLDRTTVVAVSLGAQRTWVDAKGQLCDLAQLLVGDGVRPRAQILVGRVF